MESSIRLAIRTLAVVILLMSLLTTLVAAQTVEEFLTLERCQEMDEDDSGVVEDWEEDHFYWDLPDFNNDGTQGDQEDQDTAQAYCNELLAANESEEVGPPNGVDLPDNAKVPANPGPPADLPVELPENAGPPEDRGKPENPGRPENPGSKKK